MDHDVDVIEQNPLSLTPAFDRGGVEAEVLLQAKFNFIGDGYDLAVICSGGDEKEVGETGVCGVELEDASIFALFIVTGGDGREDLAAGFRSCHCLRDSPCTFVDKGTTYGSRKWIEKWK